MGWFSTLPTELQTILLGAAGDGTGGLIAEFVTLLLGAAGRSISNRFRDSPAKRALSQSIATAIEQTLAASGVSTHEQDACKRLFKDWLLTPAVIGELRVLVSPSAGRTPDSELLQDEFEAAGLTVEYLGQPSFTVLLNRLLENFYNAAAEQSALQEILKIQSLRQISGQLDTLQQTGQETNRQLERLSILNRLIAEEQPRTNELLQAIYDLLFQARQEGYLEKQSAYQGASAALAHIGMDTDDDVPTLSPTRTSPQDDALRTHVLQLMRELISQITASQEILDPVKLAAMESRYRQLICEQFERLTFKGMSSSARPVSLPLASVYVELQAVADVPEAADTYSPEERRLLQQAENQDTASRDEVAAHLDSLRLRRWKQAAGKSESRLQRRSIHSVLADPARRCLVILGDPGSGKTTLLHYLALCIARTGRLDNLRMADHGAAQKTNTTAPGELGYLPIFVPLAAYDDHLRRSGQAESLVEFLATYYRQRRSLPGLGPLFQKAISEGRALLLLDGLDEVLDTHTRQTVAAQTSALIQQLADLGNRLVITSRTVGYREARLTGDIVHVTVVDFGPGEIRLFSQRWCEAVEAWAADGKLTPLVLRRAATAQRELLDDIHSNPSVEALASNPLLLTMLALLRRQDGKLPDRRIELYDRYIDTLLKHWEGARSEGARDKAPERFDTHEAKDHLIELALWLQENRPSGTARKRDLEQFLVEICLRFRGHLGQDVRASDRAKAERRAERFLLDMRYIAGLLAERGRDAFGFLHLTFQEYFVGRSLARKEPSKRWEIIAAHLHESRWQEPILLCLGQLGVVENRRDVVDELTRGILNSGSKHEDTLHRDLLLATAIASDDVGLSDRTLDTLSARLDELSASPVPALAKKALTGLINLARQGRTNALTALQKTLDRPDLYEDAVDLTGSLLGTEEFTPFRRALMAKLESIYDKIWETAAEALSSLATTHPEVSQAWLLLLDSPNDKKIGVALSALAPLVQTDVVVRKAFLAKIYYSKAIAALAPLVPADSEVTNAITEQLPFHAAINALAQQVFKDSALADRVRAALSSKNSQDRCAAIAALGPLGKDNANIRGELLARLQHGDSRECSQAINAMRDLLREFPDLLTAVCSCLKSKNRKVRRDAIGALAPIVANRTEVRDALLAFFEQGPKDSRDATIAALLPLLPTDEVVRSRFAARIREVAAKLGLSAIEMPAIRSALLENITNPTVIAAVAPLVESDPEIFRALIAQKNNLALNIRLSLIKTLAPLAMSNVEVRQFISTCLRDTRPQIQRAILSTAALLGATQFPEIQEILKQQLTNEEWDQGVVGTRALAPLAHFDGEARDLLLNRLGPTWPKTTRLAAAVALASLRKVDQRVDTALMNSLRNEHSALKDALLTELAPVSADDAALIAECRVLCSDSSIYVRATAARVLAPLAATDSTCRQALLSLLKDESNSVRLTAIAGLTPLAADDEVVQIALLLMLKQGLSEREEDIDAYDLGADERKAAALALAPLAKIPEVYQALKERLDDPDDDVRLAVIDGMGVHLLFNDFDILKKIAETNTRTFAITTAALRPFHAQLVMYIGLLADPDKGAERTDQDGSSQEQALQKFSAQLPMLLQTAWKLIYASVEVRNTIGTDIFIETISATSAALFSAPELLVCPYLHMFETWLPSSPVLTQLVILQLEHPLKSVRETAVQVLTKASARSPDADNALIATLRCPEPAVSALAALVQLAGSSSEIRDALLALLDTPPDNLLDQVAAALVPLLTSDSEVRQAVLRQFGRLELWVRIKILRSLIPELPKDRQLQELFLPWLGLTVNDNDYQLADDEQAETIRRDLAVAYGPLLAEDGELRSQAIAMLASPSATTRQGAAWALCALPGGPPADLLATLRAIADDQRDEESWRSRLLAATLLINDRELTQDAVLVCKAALKYGTQSWYAITSTGSEIRQQAIHTLGSLESNHRDASVFQELIQVMQSDPDFDLRDAAYSSLLRLTASAPLNMTSLKF